MKRIVFLAVAFLLPLIVQSQVKTALFSREDTLLGWNGPERACYDVHHYHLKVEVNPDKRTISGSNEMHFTVLKKTGSIQIDLAQGMGLQKVEWNGKTIPAKRKERALFLIFPDSLIPGSTHSILIHFTGLPAQAKNPPWEGGVVWTKDADGFHWAGSAVQTEGASVWWPCKDQWLDKPDSMKIDLSVPNAYMGVSNGKLMGASPRGDGFTTYNWRVSYPINHYNVTFNLGRFAHFTDEFTCSSGAVYPLDYYVMPENLKKAKRHFAQLKDMLKVYDGILGCYPFANDGYKLIETPYAGMEHQSAISYGNQYKIGYLGTDPTNLGLEFDFILLHETAHEYWGNHVSGADIADMWIHEAFGTYMEALFVEKKYGEDIAFQYIDSWRSRILNDKPMLGKRGLNDKPSQDIYYKGAFVIQTLRDLLNDNDKFLGLLKAIQQKFSYSSVKTETLLLFMNEYLGEEYDWLFYQYLKIPGVPVLVFQQNTVDGQVVLRYRWENIYPGFRLPAFVNLNGEGPTETMPWKKIVPESEWKEWNTGLPMVDILNVDEFSGYFIWRNEADKD